MRAELRRAFPLFRFPFFKPRRNSLLIFLPMAANTITFKRESPDSAVASITLSVSSIPYLADHSFNGMTVVPGTFFVSLARQLQSNYLHEPNGQVRFAEFSSPVILSESETDLQIVISDIDQKSVRYVFFDSVPDGRPSAADRPCACLEISTATDADVCAVEPILAGLEEILAGLKKPLDQETVYRRLCENENEYGPAFQGIQQAWLTGGETIARFQLPDAAPLLDLALPHPVTLDCSAHLLALLFLDQQKTFILQGLDEIEISPKGLPPTGWLRGRLIAAGPGADTSSDQHVGEVSLYDDSGRLRLMLRQVRFTFSDPANKQPSADARATPIVVASTFTADPIEASLRFWGDLLDTPVGVSFTPYNQVFQELLTPSSQLHGNSDGVNLILLNLADWATLPEPVTPQFPAVDSHHHFVDLATASLPNGLRVAHLNRHETDYVFQEIFEDCCYLRHGIRIPENATVIDIGANIGLFSLFVRSQSPHARVYSFEPSPVAYRALSANCSAYGPNLIPFNVGVSKARGTAQLTFYEKSSVFSSFHSNLEEDREAIQSVVANMVREELGEEDDAMDDYVDDLMADRLKVQTFECELLSISDIFEDNQLDHVHLLKIDAEKCELEILEGIADHHWPLIDQVVIEVHDRSRAAVETVREILVCRGFQCAVEEENLLTGSGLFNVYAVRPRVALPVAMLADPPSAWVTDLQAKTDDFVSALGAFSRAARVQTVVCFCPAASRHSNHGKFRREFAEAERDLLERIRDLPSVHALGSQELLSRYPTKNFRDPVSHELGHVPYSIEGFASIGSGVFRLWMSTRMSAFKVIALDCDNTLWQGVCGEAGPTGVVVTPAHRALQNFMIRQLNAGMLLCLCSKNAEADVWAVFDRHPEMLLRREHIAAARINWQPKSQNLRDLARELNVGLDSVLFVDDNPVECAEVRSSCPEVLTLQLPPAGAGLSRFLDHVWAFDHLLVTAEDRRRTRMVRDQLDRKKFREEAPSLAGFIAGLELQVMIVEPAANQYDRISQLTLRTNQFNCSTHRRNVGEIGRFLAETSTGAFAVTVSDRFGDYGTVGIVLYRAAEDALFVDTLLLSCRVLGRGVEHRMMAELGRRAAGSGYKWAQVPFEPTTGNQPAWDFLVKIDPGQAPATVRSHIFRFQVSQLVELRFQPAEGAQASRVPADTIPTSAHVERNGPVATTGRFQEIAECFSSVTDIVAAINLANGSSILEPLEALPATLEGKILRIWRRTIGNHRLGLNDNFFDGGGTSLKAVQTVAALRRELKLKLSVVNIFECPTVQMLADKFDESPGTNRAASAALSRGANRKKVPRRRV